MEKISILVAIGLSFTMLPACASNLSTPSPTNNGTYTETMLPAALTPTLSATPPMHPETLLSTPLTTPTFNPDSWRSLPVIPAISDTARSIYANGRVRENDPHAFSIIGDCLSLPINLFGN